MEKNKKKINTWNVFYKKWSLINLNFSKAIEKFFFFIIYFIFFLILSPFEKLFCKIKIQKNTKTFWESRLDVSSYDEIKSIKKEY